jgi:hypothetical protein
MQFILGGASVTNEQPENTYYILSGDKEDWEKWYQTAVGE